MTKDQIKKVLDLNFADIFSVSELFAIYGCTAHKSQPLDGPELRKEISRINSYLDHLPGTPEDKELIKPALYQFIKDNGPPVYIDMKLNDRFFDIIDMVIHKKPKEAA